VRQIVDHPAEPQSLIVQSSQPPWAGIVQTIAQFLQSGLQGGQWRTQFVGDVGGDAAAVLLGLDHRVGHRVDRMDEFAEFSGAAGGGAGRAVTAGEGLRSAGDGEDRPRQSAGHEHADGDRDDQRGRGGEQDPLPCHIAGGRGCGSASEHQDGGADLPTVVPMSAAEVNSVTDTTATETNAISIRTLSDTRLPVTVESQLVADTENGLHDDAVVVVELAP